MAQIDQSLAATSTDVKDLERSMAELERVGERFAAKMIDAFEAVAIRGKSLDGVFRSLALSLSDMALDAALKPFQSALGNMFAQFHDALSQLSFLRCDSMGKVLLAIGQT